MRLKFECGRVATFLELYSICAELKFGDFRGSFQFLQARGGAVSQTNCWPLHSTSPPIQFLLIMPPFDAERPTDSTAKWTHKNRHMAPQYTLPMWEFLRANSQQTRAQDSPTNLALPIFATLPLSLWFLAGARASFYSTAPRWALGLTQHPI